MRVLSYFLTAALFAQETTFRATVPVVLAPVTVTDAHGKLVDGLGIADFAVTDNGRAVRFQLDTSDTINVPGPIRSFENLKSFLSEHAAQRN